ncbi:unnamed protein product [Durusdinium trenchii]
MASSSISSASCCQEDMVINKFMKGGSGMVIAVMKAVMLMASNAHAAPLHFVHPETASVFLALVDEYLGLCCTSGFNEDSCNINSRRYVQHIAPLTHFGNLSPCLRISEPLLIANMLATRTLAGSKQAG